MKQNLTGKRFGKLTVLSQAPQLENRYFTWNCRCDCGGEIVVNTKRLTRGTITNCGCVPKAKNQRSLILTGEVFGSLTVLKRAENKGQRTAWLCKCDCGNEVVVTTQNLRASRTKSCGCKAHDNPFYRDLTGRRIGLLTVKEKTEHRDYKGSILWKCHCDCGNEVLYSADTLVHGGVKSCGCYRKRELNSKISKRPHRLEGTCIERLNIQKPRPDNRSGHVGICKINDNCYQAHIGFQGKQYYLGTFTTLEDAIKARRRGEKMHTDFLNRYYEEIRN